MNDSKPLLTLAALLINLLYQGIKFIIERTVDNRTVDHQETPVIQETKSSKPKRLAASKSPETGHAVTANAGAVKSRVHTSNCSTPPPATKKRKYKRWKQHIIMSEVLQPYNRY